MKRFHVHMHVENLNQSVGFYSKLFAAEPARLEGDYAKWMLEDPPVNFAISTRGARAGIDHLGIQTDNAEELAVLKVRAQEADLALLDEGQTTCCYARSEKHWVTDPQGIAWEHFHTLDNIPVFNERPSRDADAGGCCATPAAAPSAAAGAQEVAATGCCSPTSATGATGAAGATGSRGKPIGIAVKGASSCC